MCSVSVQFSEKHRYVPSMYFHEHTFLLSLFCTLFVVASFGTLYQPLQNPDCETASMSSSLLEMHLVKLSKIQLKVKLWFHWSCQLHTAYLTLFPKKKLQSQSRTRFNCFYFSSVLWLLLKLYFFNCNVTVIQYKYTIYGINRSV